MATHVAGQGLAVWISCWSVPIAGRALAAVVAGCVSLGWVCESSACNFAVAGAIADSLPRDGATDVPLNVQPALVGNVGSVEVRASGDAGAVEFDVEKHTTGAVVSFSGDLLPQTEYEIVVNNIATMSFTTGASALENEDVPSVEGLQVAALTTPSPAYWVYMCDGPHSYVCAGADIPDGHTLVVEAQIEGDDIGSYLVTSGMDAQVNSVHFWAPSNPSSTGRGGFIAATWDTGSCVSAHLRDMAGHRGVSTELCPGDFPVHEPPSLTRIGCTSGDLSFNDNDTEDLPPDPESGASDDAEAQTTDDASAQGDDESKTDAPSDDTELAAPRTMGIKTSDDSSGCSLRSPTGRVPGGVGFLILIGLCWRRRRS